MTVDNINCWPFNNINCWPVNNINCWPFNNINCWPVNNINYWPVNDVNCWSAMRWHQDNVTVKSVRSSVSLFCYLICYSSFLVSVVERGPFSLNIIMVIPILFQYTVHKNGGWIYLTYIYHCFYSFTSTLWFSKHELVLKDNFFTHPRFSYKTDGRTYTL